MDHTATTWLIVPARGGSKGIPRKNLRSLGGKPLILHVLQEMSTIFDHRHLIVSTDDAEIARVSEPYATIHERSAELSGDKVTLDEVTVAVLEWLLDNGANEDDLVITIQPTSPFLKAESVLVGVDKLRQGASSIISVTDDRHLRWTVDANGRPKPLYEARINRQWLPPTFAETGGIFGAHIGKVLQTKTRINTPVELIELSDREGLDIDDYNDWAVAEFQIKRKKIVIRADAGVSLGMGHIYRTLALAQELASHQLIIATRSDNGYQLGADFLSQYRPIHKLYSEEEFFDLLAEVQPDILILDILDTDKAYVERILQRDVFLVALENMGTGAQLAHIVINDLYNDLYPLENHWYGVENAILSPQFETIQPTRDTNEHVEKILVTFGGTDPNNFTRKTLEALQSIAFAGQVRVVLGPGYHHADFTLDEFSLQGEVLRSVVNMATAACDADIAVTSAGRTVTELMTLGIPMLVLCQNLRELRHTHASSVYGVINLGLGEYVDAASLAQHISVVIDESSLRHDMRLRTLQAVSNRSNQRIVQRILDAAEEAAQKSANNLHTVRDQVIK